MEPGLAPDPVAVGGEADALAGDGGIEIGEGVEVAVGDRLVDMDPERLGGLELGGVGRQIDEAEAFRDDEPGRVVPAGVVEHEHDDAVAPRASLAGEEREDGLEVLFGDAGGEMTCSSRQWPVRRRR